MASLQGPHHVAQNSMTANPFVRIEVVPQGAVTTIERDLRRLLGREDATFAKDIGSAEEPGTLVGTLVATYLSDFERGDAAKRGRTRDDGRLGSRAGPSRARDTGAE